MQVAVALIYFAITTEPWMDGKYIIFTPNSTNTGLYLKPRTFSSMSSAWKDEGWQMNTAQVTVLPELQPSWESPEWNSRDCPFQKYQSIM